ncbi:MAG: hypothetical protein Q7T64_00225 [Lacisediminimonas sp.]|nr:hypothetical protein [Lacisediminimonas sp.]
MLEKTSDLSAILDLYHPYYSKHPENTHFLVLTQSCDLVRRGIGSCKSRYLSMAPVRSLEAVLSREFDGKLRHVDSQLYASTKSKQLMQQFLARLFNNNEPSFYYLESHPTAGLAVPSCALLSLPIAIKSEHYETCLDARRTSTEDSFQAKLGWLVGQLYSRVGTKDWPEAEMAAKVERAIDSAVLWLPESELAQLEKMIGEERAKDAGTVFDVTKLRKMVASIPQKKAAAIGRIMELGIQVKLIPDKSPERFAFRRELENDAIFGSFFK